VRKPLSKANKERALASLPDAGAPLPPRKSPSKADLGRVKELFNKGWSDDAIAKELGYVNAETVRVTRYKLGLKRSARRTPIDRKEIERLYYAGLSSREIAESMGYSVNYIRKLLWLMYLPGAQVRRREERAERRRGY
jgi:DNA-directed RNA polymerase specialized sigma24 family protein